MINYLAENDKYKVYAIYENIYLKTKRNQLNSFNTVPDKFIGDHYGDPNSAIITDTHVVVSGCGISIYFIIEDEVKHFFADSVNLRWTNGVHQDIFDDYNSEFRFVSHDENNKIRVFKMNILTEEVIIVNT